VSSTLHFLLFSTISSLPPSASSFLSFLRHCLRATLIHFAWMDLSFALPHVRSVRDQTPGIGVDSLLEILKRIKGLDTLDQRTLRELIKQDGEVSTQFRFLTWRKAGRPEGKTREGKMLSSR
jgi:hypothetical protein